MMNGYGFGFGGLFMLLFLVFVIAPSSGWS